MGYSAFNSNLTNTNACHGRSAIVCLSTKEGAATDDVKRYLNRVVDGKIVCCGPGASTLDCVSKSIFDLLVLDLRDQNLPTTEFVAMLTQLARLPYATGVVVLVNDSEQVFNKLTLQNGSAVYVTSQLAEFPDSLNPKLKIPNECRGDAKCPTLPLGVSNPIQKIQALIESIAAYHDIPVLIVGESGTGKEVVARTLHEAWCPTKRFIALNCAAIPETLLETELFGYERGAFTGAYRRRVGLLEEVNGGVLFLDEIPDMPYTMQTKLLRVLQEREVLRVGGNRTIPINLHLICAANRNLKEFVDQKLFRADLYFRLNVLTIEIPPLRDRPDDIIWLAERFLAHLAARYPLGPKTLNEPAKAAMLQYSWPGNVRELKHTLEKAYILTQGPILSVTDLFSSTPVFCASTCRTLDKDIQRQETRSILEQLGLAQWRIGVAAKRLGISRKSLWQKMSRYGIKKPGVS